MKEGLGDGKVRLADYLPVLSHPPYVRQYVEGFKNIEEGRLEYE
ncbi:hypothetical protein [Bacillus sp. P14.5]|nr:hypothetical protein [Bacillus sp. P14.5]